MEFELELRKMRLLIESLDTSLVTGQISLDDYTEILKTINYKINEIENKILDYQRGVH